MEGGSCNDYDYVCGDPVNGSDLSGLRGTKALPDRDAECLGGNYDQLTSAGCTAYRTAKASGDSDFYYKGKTFTDPGTPNAFLTTTAAGLKSGARYTGYAAARVGKPFVMSYKECSAAAPFAAGAAAPAGPEASLAAVAATCLFIVGGKTAISRMDS